MAKHHHYTPEQDTYLANIIRRPLGWEEITRRFNKHFKTSIKPYNMQSHVLKSLKLHRPPSVIKKLKQMAIQKCLDKRGGEEFNERMRQRALYSPNHWGGKHNNGNPHWTKEYCSAQAKKYFTPEVRQRAQATRKETVKKERRRLMFGLEQKTNLRIQPLMTKEQKNIRYQMRSDCDYILIPFDPNIYYDDNTKRSECREERARKAGVKVLRYVDEIE